MQKQGSVQPQPVVKQPGHVTSLLEPFQDAINISSTPASLILNSRRNDNFHRNESPNSVKADYFKVCHEFCGLPFAGLGCLVNNEQMPISIKTVRQFVDGIGWARLYKKAETATKGQRLYPSQSKDKKLNFRIDKGAKINENQHEIVLQANKDAENAEVKKAAQTDSHRILAKCVIDPENEDGRKAKLALEESFKANN